MTREISAGGVVVQPTIKGWQMAVIEPQQEASPKAVTLRGNKKSQKLLLALPKGLVDPGEKPEQTALREVKEETGLTASLVAKLGDSKYVYTRSWGDRQRVFKIVSFFLLRYESGDIDQIADEMRVEVKQALWIPLAEAEHKLAYKGEQDMVRRAQEYLREHAELSNR